ncbi:MAG: hypothetical protein V4643_11615 [Bacteroidota bacterium]
MLFPKAKKIGKQFQWHKTSDAVFGLYKNYFFTIGDAAPLNNIQYKFVEVKLHDLNEQQIAAIENELSSNKKNLKFSQFEITPYRIDFKFMEHLRYTKITTVYALMDFLVDLFNQMNLPPTNNCINCQASENLNYFNVNDNGSLLCKNCAHEIENEFAQSESQKKSEEKGYLTGIVGGLSYSFPVIVAWIVLAVYAGFIFSGTAIILALLGFMGYHSFKGKNGPFTRPIIILTFTVSLIIANYCTSLFLLMHAGASFNDGIFYIQNDYATKAAFKDNLAMSFIYSLLAWIYLIFILKTKKLSISLAKSV